MDAPVQLSAAQFTELLGRLSTNTGQTAANEPKASVKPVRPTVDVETSESEWLLFDDNWKRYKRMAKLTAEEDIRDNLRQCCSEHLNKRLFDIRGPAALNAATETELLEWIKEIAVKGVHKEVHRTQFVKLRQKQGESINSYYGRLKAESSLCELKVTAPATCGSTDCQCENHGVQVSYQEDLVATQLIAGLYNAEHQAKILSEGSTLPSLNDKLQRLLVLERSDSSISSLNPEPAAASAHANVTRGSFQKNDQSEKGKKKWNRKSGPRKFSGSLKNDSGGNTQTDGDGSRNGGSDRCSDCGKKHARCRSCQGYHKCTSQCNSCKGMGHIRNCCPTANSANVNRTTAPSSDSPSLEEEGVVCFYVTGMEHDLSQDAANLPVHKGTHFGSSPSELDSFDETLVAPPTVATLSTVDLPPHLVGPITVAMTGTVDSLSCLNMEPLSHMEFVNKEFQRTKPDNAPMLQVSCKLLVGVHARYGKLLSGKRHNKAINTSGLADTGAQICTGGSELLSALNIDASFLVLTGMSVSGLGDSRVNVLGALFLEISSNGRCTRQIVYIASEARSMILSEKALKDLGVIPENFPCAGMFGQDKDQSTVQRLSAKPADVKLTCQLIYPNPPKGFV